MSKEVFVFVELLRLRLGVVFKGVVSIFMIMYVKND